MKAKHEGSLQLLYDQWEDIHKRCYLIFFYILSYIYIYITNGWKVKKKKKLHSKCFFFQAFVQYVRTICCAIWQSSSLIKIRNPGSSIFSIGKNLDSSHLLSQTQQAQNSLPHPFDFTINDCDSLPLSNWSMILLLIYPISWIGGFDLCVGWIFNIFCRFSFV